MNTKPPEKPSTHQDKAPAPKIEFIEKPGKPNDVFLRRFVLPMIPILVIIFIIAAPLAWLIAPSPTTQSKSHPPVSTATSEANTEESASTPEISKAENDQRIPKPSLPEEEKPLPPNVYWSVLTQQLLDLETERAAIIELLAKQLPPPSPSNPDQIQNDVTAPEEKVALAKTMTTTPELSVPPPPAVGTEITWTTIGQQVLELEKQRESATTAVANKLKQ